MTGRKTQILSCLLSFVLGVGIGVGGYRVAQEIISKSPIEIEPQISADNGGMLLPEETAGNGMKLMSAKIAAEDYEENGITPQAENAYTLTATITPSYASNKTVDWKLEFSDASSAWASGKTVTDYVTITPSADGALTASLVCVQDFGEPIIVTVTSRDNPSASASCTVDYAKKVVALKMRTNAPNLSTPLLPSGEVDVTKVSEIEGNFQVGACVFTLMWTFEFTDYTIDDDPTLILTSTINESVFDEFKAALGEEEGSKFSIGTNPTQIVSFKASELASATSKGTIMSMFQQINHEGSMMFYMDTEATNLLSMWLKDNLEKDILIWTFAITGTYSSVTYTRPIRFTEEGVKVSVSSVELDESNVIV